MSDGVVQQVHLGKGRIRMLNLNIVRFQGCFEPEINSFFDLADILGTDGLKDLYVHGSFFRYTTTPKIQMALRPVGMTARPRAPRP